MFRQNKKHITNFMMEFETLAIKAETHDLHTIFLFKKCPDKHYQNNIGIPTDGSTRDTQRIEDSDHLSKTRM